MTDASTQRRPASIVQRVSVWWDNARSRFREDAAAVCVLNGLLLMMESRSRNWSRAVTGHMGLVRSLGGQLAYGHRRLGDGSITLFRTIIGRKTVFDSLC